MLLTEQDVKKLTGLSGTDIEMRLKTHGYNELPSAKRRSVFGIALSVFKEPMFLLLVSCGLLYLIMGDIQEAMMLLGFVFFIMGITIYQEGKTEKALDALKDLSSPRALVIRNSIHTRIPGKEVVPGDLIILAEGDRIPADGILLWGVNLSIDESILTGESVAVRKAAAEPGSSISVPGGDDMPGLFSGTLVVQGQGVYEVCSTGIKTELGKIGVSLSNIKQEKTLIETETARIVKIVFITAVVLCLLTVIFYGFINGNSVESWLKGFLRGITLAMAMLPEEFPVVLTIFMALGAWRLSHKKVLTRKMSAIETLGAATVLCSDKTGTLTQNRMSIRCIYNTNEILNIDPDKREGLPDNFHELIEHAILASQKDPFDPMESALKDLGTVKLANTEHLHENWKMVREYPLSKELLALSHVWESIEGDKYIVSAKGAPEAIFNLCHLDDEKVSLLMNEVNGMAAHGLRVLGVAKSSCKKMILPEIQHDFEFVFLGLIGLQDPIRETVPDAVRLCYEAGIRVIMITGDYPATAQNIAGQIGLADIGNVITGSELAALSENEISEKIKHTNIFARMIPDQKIMIVNALKKNGEIVAMTGDGVNDAPALKAAHIGVAMGERGTDVARESSDLVLLDDSFTSIVSAIRTGRRIFDNLKKAMAYIISVHIPIAGLSFLPVVFRWEEILFPVHIVFLELIIDPSCSIVFEAENEEKDIMHRKPRGRNEHLFGKNMLRISFLQGIVALLVVLAVYRISVSYFNQSYAEARTFAFTALIISNLSLILTNRSWSLSIFRIAFIKNSALIWVFSGALIFLAAVIYVPFLQNVFHFVPLSPMDLLIAVGAGVISITWFEIVKLIARLKKINLLKN